LARLGGLTKFCKKTLEWAELGLTVNRWFSHLVTPNMANGQLGKNGRKKRKKRGLAPAKPQ
jgi:hypothetical protein